MKARRRVLDAHDSTPTIRTNLPCWGRRYAALPAAERLAVLGAMMAVEAER